MDVKDFLFDILRWQICGQKSENLQRELDLEAQISLYKLSTAHDLAHIIANGLFELGTVLDEKVGAAFRKQQMIAVFRYEKLKKDFLDICACFDSANIEYTPLKGSVLRNYYEHPWMRTSCDIDILVSESNLEAARSLLVEKLGFEDNGKSSHDVQLFSPAKTHIELHYSLIEVHDLDTSRAILENYPKYSVSGEGARLDFSDEFFYYFHIDHMAKHFQHGGCGIRPFMDLWVLENKVPHDKQKRESLLQEGKMLTFANAATDLMRVWFEGAKHTEITAMMEEYILSGGVYGTLDNFVAMNQQKRGGKLRYALSRIFLTHDQLKYMYPILEKHRWLLPVVQVRRWCRLVFCGSLRSSLNELHKNATMDQKEVDKSKVMLEYLQLNQNAEKRQEKI